jgi:hypothetical protein
MDTVRIELGADWARVWPYMRHKTMSLLQKDIRRYLKPRGKPVLLSELTPDTMVNDYEVDTANFDQHTQNDIKLLNQVVEWSFGPMTQATLDDMPAAKYDTLVAEVDKLYAAAPLTGRP